MRYTTVLLAIAACALLAGCASTGNRSEIAQTSGFYSDVDWEYMSQVTSDAKQRGYKIVWVNPPQKKRYPDSH